MYQAIVTPILEYAIPAWNPNLIKVIESLDKVQDRCAKLTSPPLNFQELADRRWQADMCEVYKYVNGLYKSNPISLSHGSWTRFRQKFFSYRVVNDWNRLPEDLFSEPSLPCFKRMLRSVPSSKRGNPTKYTMMTSSNGNILRVAGPLSGEFTGCRWITITGASDAELSCFLWSAPWINGWVNNREAGDLSEWDILIVVIIIALLLAHYGLVTTHGNIKFGQYFLGLWLVWQ